MPNRIGYNGSDKWKEKATELLNQGGSSNVIANPSGTATDNLYKLQVDQTIYAITGGGGGGSNIDIVNIPMSAFSWQSNIYVYRADIPSGVVESDIIGVAVYVKEQVSMAVGSIYDGKVWVQIYSPYNNYKGDGTENLICNLLVRGSGGGGGDTEIIVHTTAEWQGLTSLVSKKGGIYVWSDYKTENNIPIPAIKIGDGLAYVVDLPFATLAITQTQINNWNNKVSARVSGENLILEN